MSEVRWLSDSEQRAWRSYLASGRLLFEALERQLQQDAGIPHAYYEILVNLSEAPERSLRMSVLAERTRSSRSRLSHAIDRLNERGWVDRVDCDTDRRGQLAVLTDVGFAALEAAAPGHVTAVRELLFDQLTEAQVAAMEQIGDAIVARVAPCDAAHRETEATCDGSDAA